jgi:biopolymer transport protein ExbB
MLQSLMDGGILIVPLVILSILCIAVIIDRLRAFKIASADTTELRNSILEDLEKGEVDKAIRDCESFEGPVAAVMLVGLVKFRKLVNLGRPLAEIESNVNKTMGDYAPHLVEALEKRLNMLTMIAAVAPLLGMTGTVTGMIKSFDTMKDGMDAGAVAVGISEALVTTATGLIVAIPAVIAFSFFSKKIDRIVLDMEESATDLIDAITLEYEIETEDGV